jgi:hypothetical protein
VSECAPTASDEVLSTAEPEDTGADPSELAPSKNSTVPVAEAGVTVAVRATLWPVTDGFGELVSAVLLPAAFTVWLCAADVLPLKFGSPA